MNNAKLIIGDQEISGFSEGHEIISPKRPWWRVIEYAEDHPDYKADAITLELVDKYDVEIILSLKKGSDSLDKIMSCDPYGENIFVAKLI